MDIISIIVVNTDSAVVEKVKSFLTTGGEGQLRKINNELENIILSYCQHGLLESQMQEVRESGKYEANGYKISFYTQEAESM